MGTSTHEAVLGADPSRSCHRKARYNSKRAAKREGKTRRGDVDIYHCPICGFWHLSRRVRP